MEGGGLMTFTVRDLGPISSGKITLRPLTVFIGPGGSGKSYAATAIHSILRSHPSGARFRGRLARYRLAPPEGLYGALEKALAAPAGGRQAAVPKPLVDKIIRGILSQTYAVNAGGEMSRAFGTDVAGLAREGAGRFSISVGYGKSGVRVSLKNGRPGPIPPSYGLRVTVGVGRGRGPHRTEWKGDSECAVLLGTATSVRQAADAVCEACAEYITRDVPDRSHYIPAVRSGVIQAYRAIAQSIVQRAAYAGAEDARAEGLPGRLADMLSDVMEFGPGAAGHYLGETAEFEREITRGKITVRNPGGLSVPDIRYEGRGHSVPMHLAPSAASEAAPLILYMRHLVRRHDMVTMEEPEAHLHPSGQEALARFVVRLVRGGLRVLVTTHSPYFLYVVNTALLRGGISKGRGRGDFLRPDEVALHVFKRAGRGAHVIRQASTRDGIPGDEFSDVDMRLYEEKLKVLRKIDRAGGRG